MRTEEQELPEPAFRLTWNGSAYYVSKPNIGDTDCYTADQMRAALAAHPKPAAPTTVSDDRLYELADSPECNPDKSGWGQKFDFLAFGRAVEREVLALRSAASAQHVPVDERWCKKCGYLGPDQVHQRPGTSAECHYLSTLIKAGVEGASDLGRTAPAAPQEATLPYDITAGGGTFRKGVKLSTFVMAAQAWHRQANPKFYTLTDEDKAENLRKLQGTVAGGDAS